MPDWLCNLFSHVWPSIPGKEFNEATDKWLHCLLRGNPEDNSAGESGVYIWRNQPHCRGQGSLDVVTSRCGHCSMNTMVVTQGVSENHPMDYWSIALPTTLSVTTKDWAPQSDIYIIVTEILKKFTWLKYFNRPWSEWSSGGFLCLWCLTVVVGGDLTL